jgi:protein-export membrane protein SecD
MKQKIKAGWMIIIIGALGLFLVKGANPSVNTDGRPSAEGRLGGFVLGLDLAGGSALTYTIDTSNIPKEVSVSDSVSSLRDVVERRVNLFGVREPTVTTQYSSLANEWRLVVELPGVTDVAAASKMIGETPVLDFRTVKNNAKPLSATSTVAAVIENFEKSQLTGQYLERAALAFDQTTNKPHVELIFNEEGARLFAQITKANIGKQIAIFLDGVPISSPVVNEEITGGRAVISGTFTIEEAKTLVNRLNAGALPLPVKLSSTSIVPPILGQEAVHAGVKASIIGFILVALFMILWYRLPGFMASLGLVAYSTIMLALFKYIPVTLTSAGIAGFIISVGLAVDANVLTFERMKEEIRSGKGLPEAVQAGFARAWTSIRDSHIAAIIVSIILFWMGTSIVKGFAFTFFLGAVISLISAQLITKVFMQAIANRSKSRLMQFLFSSGASTK